jgi:hypothetical protein
MRKKTLEHAKKKRLFFGPPWDLSCALLMKTRIHRKICVYITFSIVEKHSNLGKIQKSTFSGKIAYG